MEAKNEKKKKRATERQLCGNVGKMLMQNTYATLQ